MKFTKQFVSILLALILCVSAMVIPAVADGEPAFALDRTADPATNQVIYFDNYNSTAHTLGGISITEHSCGVAAFNAEDPTYTKILPNSNSNGDIVTFASFPFAVKTASDLSTRYASLRYMIVGAEASFVGTTKYIQMENVDSGSREKFVIPLNIQNDVWQTATVDLNAAATWSTENGGTGSRIGQFNAGRVRPHFPVMNDGAYIVVDYLGFFANTAAAETQATKAAADYELRYPTPSPITIQEGFSNRNTSRVIYFDHFKNNTWTDNQGHTMEGSSMVIGTLSAATESCGITVSNSSNTNLRIAFINTTGMGIAPSHYISIRYKISNATNATLYIQNKSNTNSITLPLGTPTGDWQVFTALISSLDGTISGNLINADQHYTLLFNDASFTSSTAITVDYVGAFGSEDAAAAEAANQAANWNRMDVKNTISFKGVQFGKGTEENTAKLRLVGSIKVEEAKLSTFDGVGFDVKVAGDPAKTFSTPADKQGLVYTSVTAGSDTVNADSGSFLFTLAVNNIPNTLTDLAFEVTPYYVVGGVKVLSTETATFHYSAAANDFVKN